MGIEELEINLKQKVMDKAKEIAKEILEPNDTSVDAKLILNGSEYEIETFNVRFEQEFDYKGEPQREVKGGFLSMTINHIVDKQINHWMFDPSVKYSGVIVFASFSRIANPVITIEFVNGRCFQYSKNIDQTVSYHLLITAEEIKINGIDHTNNPDFI